MHERTNDVGEEVDGEEDGRKRGDRPDAVGNGVGQVRGRAGVARGGEGEPADQPDEAEELTREPAPEAAGGKQDEDDREDHVDAIHTRTPRSRE